MNHFDKSTLTLTLTLRLRPRVILKSPFFWLLHAAAFPNQTKFFWEIYFINIAH